MKKLKLTKGRRALLYILTPLFCAFLCLGAVFSIPLNSNKVYAAASPTAIMSVTNTCFREVTSSSTADYSVRNPSFSYDDIIKKSFKLTNETDSTLTNQSNTANYTLQYVGNSAKPTLNGHFVLTEFTIGYRIPARTEYKVDYNFAISMQRSNSALAQGCSIELFMLGETGAADCGTLSGTTLSFTSYTDSPYVVAKANKTGNVVASDTFSTSVTYSNKTNDVKTITTSLVLRAGNTASPGTTSYWNYAKFTAQSNVTEINDLWVEAPADVSVDYSDTEYTDSNLDLISSIANASWYDPSKMTLSLQDGSAQNAGFYNIDVALINNNVETDDPWKLSNGTFSHATQTIKLTINKLTPIVSFGNASTTDQYTAKGTQDEFPTPTVTYNGKTVAGTINWGSQCPEGSASGTRKDYDYTFTPEDTTNYNPVTSSISLNYFTAKVQSITVSIKDPDLEVFASTDKTTLVDDFFTVMVKYQGIAEEEEVTSYDIIGWKAGDNVPVKVMIGTVISNTVTVPSIGIDKINNLTVIFNQGSNVITPLTTGEELKPMFTNVIAEWNYSSETKSLAANEYEVEFTPVLGTDTSTVTVKYTNSDGTVVSATPIGTITVIKAVYNVADITLSGNKTSVYDGDPHALTTSGTMPAGVTAHITYLKDGDAVASSTAPTDAGTYTVTLTFTQDDTDNYETITKTVTETLTIAQATVTGISFVNDTKPEITGTSYTLEATGVPSWVTVEYFYDGQQFTGATAAGSYLITAKFTIDDEHASNYVAIGDKTATLTISDKPPVEGAENIVVKPTISATYTGSAVDYTAKNVPSGVTVSYEVTKTGDASFSGDIINAGEYTVTVKFVTGADKAPIADKTCVITIAKANYNSVSFGDKTYVYDGNEHTLTITGTLSDGVEETYSVEGEEGTSFTEIGEYEFTVTFDNPDPENYNDMQPLTATLKIVEPSATGITATVASGTYLDVLMTLADLEPHITVTINKTGNNSETTDDFVLTCATLRDGGLFEVGQQTITVTHGDYTTTVTVTVNKAKAALPVYSGTLRYTGNEIKPKATDFEGFDSATMTFVESKLQGGVDRGSSYKAVFALKDTTHYEWATASAAAAYSKKLFAKVATFDGEAADIQLADNEIAVDWNVAKAVVSATKASSGLPVFKSASYKGSWADAVSLRYYTDETCTTEVEAGDLVDGEKYYAKVELVDAANFELDDSLASFLDPFPYTKAAPALSTGDKILNFIKANWLWLLLLLVVLLVIIIIVAICKGAAKKKREREEERRQERMMRYMQTEGMPDYIPMMQSARMAGTTVSPELFAILSGINAKIELLQNNMAGRELPPPSQSAGSGSASPELLTILNGMNAKIDKLQSDMAANELASARDDRLRSEIKSAGNGAQSGVSAAEISQMVNAAVKNALAENKARPAPKDLGSRPLVQPEPKIIREPIDDDRVVDWGGFYNLADEQDLPESNNPNKKK